MFIGFAIRDPVLFPPLLSPRSLAFSTREKHRLLIQWMFACACKSFVWQSIRILEHSAALKLCHRRLTMYTNAKEWCGVRVNLNGMKCFSTVWCSAAAAMNSSHGIDCEWNHWYWVEIIHIGFGLRACFWLSSSSSPTLSSCCDYKLYKCVAFPNDIMCDVAIALRPLTAHAFNRIFFFSLVFSPWLQLLNFRHSSRPERWEVAMAGRLFAKI